MKLPAFIPNALRRLEMRRRHGAHPSGCFSPAGATEFEGRQGWRRRFRAAGFTMIEIAISLAVIGFALVAIIGILPTGMNVQKENREETIINQEAMVLLDGIRTGARGLDDLTNYVVAITNHVTEYNRASRPVNQFSTGYTFTDSTTVPKYPITNGFRIIGLLSQPKYQPPFDPANLFRSNHIFAYIRSMSGMASEKVPQNNPAVQDLAFAYRLYVDVLPYFGTSTNSGTGFRSPWVGYYDIDSTNYAAYGFTNDWVWRSNNFRIANNMLINLHDVRLTFRWPVLPNGNLGNNRLVFRTMASGQLLETREPNFDNIPIFFFDPRTYVKAP